MNVLWIENQSQGASGNPEQKRPAPILIAYPLHPLDRAPIEVQAFRHAQHQGPSHDDSFGQSGQQHFAYDRQGVEEARFVN
jgi:hypothetical protein